MRLKNTEKKLIEFLRKYPNQWHTYHHDGTTLRTVGALLVLNGLGLRGFKVSTETSQMFYDSEIANMGNQGD